MSAEQERAAALAWVEPALEAIAGVEKDIGKPLDDEIELGRIYESESTPSFRIRVGHIRKLAALARRGAGQAVPDGWVLVPVERTQAMFLAMEKAGVSFQTQERMWPAMLAAAPKPEDKP